MGHVLPVALFVDTTFATLTACKFGFDRQTYYVLLGFYRQIYYVLLEVL